MKICHVIEAAGGGSGQIVIDLLQSNIAKGYDTTLVFSPERVEKLFLDEVEKIKGSIRVLTTPMQRKISLRDFADGWKLHHILKKAGPFDVIHSHSSKAGALTRLCGLLLPKKTIHIYSSHAFVTMGPYSPRYFGWIEWMLSWLCNYIICSSVQELEHAHVNLKIARSKLKLIYNGIALDYHATEESARTLAGVEKGVFVVGFTGRLVPQKNVFRLLDAFSLAQRRNHRMHLIIAGDGEQKPYLLKKIKEKSLEKKITILSGLNARDLMPAFDCLICSSDYESFGLVIIEAMAAGIPVITHRVGIAEEAIIDGENGYIVDFKASEIVTSIEKLTAMPESGRIAFSLAAKNSVQKFGTDRMQKLTDALYQEAMHK